MPGFLHTFSHALSRFARFSGTGYHLLPGLCLRCGLPSGRHLDLCPGCEADLAPLGSCCPCCAVPLPAPVLCGDCLASPPAFVRALAAYRYQPPLSDLVIALKSRRDLAAGKVLGTLLARHVAQQLGGNGLPDLLVPVPLHWRRRLRRGFNQALELARPVARELSLPLAPALVRRSRHLVQQHKQRHQRRRDLRDAFRVVGEVQGRHIAIIDDVVTTTGTARALSQALVASGAQTVEVWCLARTPFEW